MILKANCLSFCHSLSKNLTVLINLKNHNLSKCLVFHPNLRNTLQPLFSEHSGEVSFCLDNKGLVKSSRYL